MSVFNFANGDSLSSIRTKLNAKLSPIIDVKADFGAVGDGIADDRVPVQSAFDAAWGTWASSHGAAGSNNNRPVYFPVGTYNVSSPAATTITNVVSGASSWCLLSVASTTGFATDDMCYVRGVVGVPNANGSYSIQVVSAGTPGTILLRNATFSGAYVSGGTIAQPCLRIRDAYFQMYGSGLIKATSPNCAVLTLNGVQGTIHNISLYGSDQAGTIGLDYNWYNLGEISSQSCGFYNMLCSGADYGMAIGWGGAMCSETTISKCFFAGRTGVICVNQNALSQNILGGNISGCKDYGIYVAGGDIPVIQGIGFQSYPEATLAGFGYVSSTTMTITSMTTTRQPGVGFEVGDIIKCQSTSGVPLNTTILSINTGTGGVGTYTLSNSFTFGNSGDQRVLGVAGKADIYMPNGQGDAISIQGCRSESHNFLWLPYPQPYSVSACAHLGGDEDQGDSFFYHGAANLKISACSSGSWMNLSSGSVEIDSACNFTGTDYWRHTTGADPNNPTFVSINPPPIITDATTARSTLGLDNGCLIQFTSSSSITYTLTKTDTNATRMRVGSWIDIQQYGSGVITLATASGVTMHAPTAQGSVTTHFRYSTVRVTVVATNTYVVSGDITP